VGREVALHRRRQERRRRPLARHVTQGESDDAVAEFEVVEEVTTNGATRRRAGREVDRGAPPARFGQQGPLDLGGHLEVAVRPRLLCRLGVHPCALDGEGGLRGERLE
jgi:hypothetical protein